MCIRDSVFSIYDLSDDNFALSPEYDLLYTELTGAVILYIEAVSYTHLNAATAGRK